MAQRVGADSLSQRAGLAGRLGSLEVLGRRQRGSRLALVIKYLSQPHAGDEVTVGDDVAEVRFGRGMDADVGFPAELDVVARDHFRLRRELGRYRFVISRDHPVFSRGRALMDGEELDQVTEVQLSGPTGPRLRIERVTETHADMPKTRVLRKGRDIGDVAEGTLASRRRLGRGLIAVTVLIAAIAGGYFLIRQDIDAIKAEIPSLAQQLDGTNAAAGERINAASIIAKNKESIYYVQMQMPTGSVLGTGTASVVLMPDGTKALATNAHVAEMFLQAKNNPANAGMKVVVVQPKGPDYPQLDVVGVKIHPAWGPSNAAIERIMRKVVANAAQDVKPMLGYDVALMFVSDPSKLGEPLTYASRETIKALKTGDPLLLIGYAGEGLRGTDTKRPEPTSQTGIVTSMTTFYLYKGSDDEDLLVQHSVPAAGGASGSPMFNDKGEVVALINAVNVADIAKSGARMTSAALVNYAQRADMLLDLISGEAQAKMPVYLKQMADAEARLSRTPDQILQDLTAMLGEAAGDQTAVKELGSFEAVIDQKLPDTPHGLYVGRLLQLEPQAMYLIVAMSDDQRPIAMLGLDQNQKIVMNGPNSAFVTYLMFDNQQAKLAQLLYATVDVSSVGEAAVKPGKVTIHIYQADPKGGS